MRNLPLLDVPYNIFKLEVFDFLLALALPSPVFVLGTVHPLLFLPYPFLAVLLGIKIRDLKKDKEFGYMQRYFHAKITRVREKILGERRVLYP